MREDRRGDLNPIPKLWAPLLRSLDQAEKKLWEGWVQRGLASADSPPKPIKVPHPDLSSGKLRCRYCGVKFYRIDRSAYAYCSDKCAGAAHSAAMVRARAAARADRQCQTCGLPIEAKRSTMKFCSVKCRVAAHRGASRNGGHAVNRALTRREKALPAWRAAIRKAWLRDHPGTTLDDYEVAGSCADTHQGERAFHKWFDEWMAREGEVGSRGQKEEGGGQGGG